MSVGSCPAVCSRWKASSPSARPAALLQRAAHLAAQQRRALEQQLPVRLLHRRPVARRAALRAATVRLPALLLHFSFRRGVLRPRLKPDQRLRQQRLRLGTLRAYTRIRLLLRALPLRRRQAPPRPRRAPG